MASSSEMLLERVRSATEDEYTIEGELGRGGMAAVFLARDRALDRRVAIKVMLPDLVDVEGIQDRFVIEAKTSAKLDHPGIVTVYSVKQRAGLLCIVMKFIEGRTLDAILETQKRLESSVVTTLGARVAEALHYAHGEGIVHRDVKPSNILIDTRGRPVVTDFGIAKVMSARSITVTGSVLGTPTYMSPEQCRGLPATAASDQYSLGVMLYEMLTGAVPFTGSIFELIHMHCDEPPKPLLEVMPDIDPVLVETVMTMMAKKPADRFPSLADVAKRLQSSTPKRRLSTEVSDTIAAMARASSTAGGTPRTASDASGAATELATTPAPGLVVTPAEPIIEVGQTLLMRVSEASGASLAGVRIVWRSEDPTVATVEENGLVTGRSVGLAKITASAGPSVGRVPLTVRAPNVDTLVVTPQNPELVSDAEIQFVATALDSRGITLSGQQIVWQSSDVSVCAVSSQGRAIAVAPGSATITATCGKVKGEAKVRVRLPAVERIVVTPVDPRVEADETRRLTATVYGADERVIADRKVAWQSSAPAVATVDADGTLKGVAPGTAVIKATCEGKEGLVSVSVRAQPVVAVRIQPAQLRLEVGRSLQLKGVGEDRSGRAVTGHGIVWHSDDNKIALIDASGKVVAVKEGKTRVHAGVGDASSAVEVTVIPRAVTQIRIEPHAPKIVVGEFVTIDATLLDAEGGVLTGREIAWTSDDPNVVKVNANGSCEAKRPGSVRITAACEGARATTKLGAMAAVAGANAATMVVDRAELKEQMAAGAGAAASAATIVGGSAHDAGARGAQLPPSVTAPAKRGNRGMMIGGVVVLAAAAIGVWAMSRGSSTNTATPASSQPVATADPSVQQPVQQPIDPRSGGTTNPGAPANAEQKQTPAQKQVASDQKQAPPNQKTAAEQKQVTLPEQKQVTPPEQKQVTPPEQKQVTPPEQKQVTPPEQKQVTPPEQKAPPVEQKQPPPVVAPPANEAATDPARAAFCGNGAALATALNDALASDPAGRLASLYQARDAADGRARTSMLDAFKGGQRLKATARALRAESAGSACEWVMRLDLNWRAAFGGNKDYAAEVKMQADLVGGVVTVKHIFGAVKK